MRIRVTWDDRRKRWRVESRTPLRRRREWFTSRADADAHAAQLTRDERAGALWVDLSDAERRTLAMLHREAHEAGTTLADVWREWQAGVRSRGSGRGITLGDAITRCIVDKGSAGRRANYVASLHGYLDRFARGREALPLRSIGREEIREWLDGFRGHARATQLARLSTLFSWAVTQDLIQENPCDRIQRVTVEPKPPRILTVEESDRILRLVQSDHPRALAWFALCLCAGIRPLEADRLTWSAVDLSRGIVTVDAAASKVRQRRIVTLLPCAVAWIGAAVGSDLPLPHSTRRRAVRAVREAIGWDSWPADILRHTAASYWLAHRQDAGAVAHQLGNSAGVLLRVYREIVSREDAERWVAMRP